MRPRILIVEDDANLALGLRETLGASGYHVEESRRGDAALARLKEQAFDLVLLDIMIPGRSGHDVLEALRERGDRTPVVVLSARGQEIDKVLGLRLGADDYVAKPFGVQELLARVEAVLRRRAREGGADAATATEIRIGEARIDTAARTVALGRKRTSLTARELDVLVVLHRERGRVVTRERLLAEVWGAGYEGTDRALDQVVLKLRAKLEPRPAEPRYLRTVHGVGYRLDP